MTPLESMNYGRKHGISPSCLHPLLVLIDDSPLTISELGSRTGTSKSNMTGLADRLEKDGWVTRTRVSRDRREIHLIPTEKSFEIFSPLIPI